MVRALCLLVLYKPVQHATLFQAGISDPQDQEASAKINAYSSSILTGFMFQTAFALRLPSITTTFANSSRTIPMLADVVGDLRLWLWLCVVDTHGALASGRSGRVQNGVSNMTTRSFASLKLQSSDVRLAAMVELYAAARFAVSGASVERDHIFAPHELKMFNLGLKKWEEYWQQPLRDAAVAGDELAQCVSLSPPTLLKLMLLEQHSDNSLW